MSNDPLTMRTDLRRVRHFGSARSGTTHAHHMRLTSLALVPLTVAFVWLVLSLLGRPFPEVRETLSHPLPALVLLLFLATGIYHMHLGMRTIIEDYVHGEHLKEWSLAGSLFFCVVVGLACIYAVMLLSFT